MQHKQLSSLKVGEKAVVVGFNEGPIALKLLEMGVLPGTEVLVKHIAPFGCPIAIDMNNYLLALRKSEAEAIHII
jgi:ferrous iron transport protein A